MVMPSMPCVWLGEGEEVDGIERRDDGFRRREGGGEKDEQRQKGCKQLFGFHVMMIPS